MDSVVKCTICGEFRSKSNIRRHHSMCRLRGSGDDDQSRASSVARSRSTSTDSGKYTEVSQGQEPAGYSPQGISTMLSSIILEAVSAVLDQHSAYSLDKLTSYLARHYPEIPDQLRAPIILAATAGARKAASMHNIWEKNIHSPDPARRSFATAAASSLSFWTFGLLPVHRSGDVYAPLPEEQSKAVMASKQPPVKTALQLVQSAQAVGDENANHELGNVELQRDAAAPDQLAVAMLEIRGDRGSIPEGDGQTVMLESVQLPVPIESGNREFSELMKAARGQSSELFPRAEELLGMVRNLPAAMSPIHPGRTVDSDDGREVQPELEQSSAVKRPLVEMAVTGGAGPLSSSLQSVKQTDDRQLQQPAPDADTPLVIHAASDIELDVDDTVQQTSAPRTEVVVRGGIGSMPAGTSSHKRRSPEVRKPAPQRRSCPHPYPEHRSGNTGSRRHNSPAYRRTWSGGRPGERPSRAGDTYVVNADEYRRFQEYTRNSSARAPRL